MKKQTALQVFHSTVYFGGHVIFSGNNGSLGGTIMLQGGSRFYLRPYTHIQMINNHAKKGGGIYVEDQNAATTIPCFFQIVGLQNPYSHLDAMITLERQHFSRSRKCSVWSKDRPVLPSYQHSTVYI